MEPLSLFDQASVITHEALLDHGLHPNAPEYQPLWLIIHSAVLKGMMSVYF